MKRLLSDVEVQVEQYEDKFRELNSALQRSVFRRGIVLRVTGIVNNLGAYFRLHFCRPFKPNIIYMHPQKSISMTCPTRASFDSKEGCLAGTPEDVIQEISNWVNSDGDDVPRMLLLKGVAGSGKPAISHTVAQ